MYWHSDSFLTARQIAVKLWHALTFWFSLYCQTNGRQTMACTDLLTLSLLPNKWQSNYGMYWHSDSFLTARQMAVKLWHALTFWLFPYCQTPMIPAMTKEQYLKCQNPRFVSHTSRCMLSLPEEPMIILGPQNQCYPLDNPVFEGARCAILAWPTLQPSAVLGTAWCWIIIIVNADCSHSDKLSGPWHWIYNGLEQGYGRIF